MTLRRRTMFALPLLAAGTRTALAQPADWARVTEAANQGARLTVHHNVPPPLGDLWLNEFRKAFPRIAVEAARLPSAEMMQRFGTEYPAGVSRTDVIITLWDETLAGWAKQGWVRQWLPPESAAIPGQYKRDNQFFTLHLIRGGMVSHKSRIRDAEAPTEWADFFDPKWRGKIGINPPWRSVAVQEMLALWEEMGMKDVAQRLKAHDVRFFNGSAGIVQAVIRGDILVSAVIEPPVISALEDGAPIRIHYPKSGVPATSAVLFLPDRSPFPDAGMVFANWALSMPGQQLLQDIAGAPVVRPGVRPPKLVPGLDGMKVVLTEHLLTPAKQKAMVDEWRTVFGVK